MTDQKKEEVVDDRHPETFFPLFHAFIRGVGQDHEANRFEQSRAKSCIEDWLMTHIPHFAQVCTPVENAMVAFVIDHYMASHQAPSLATLKDLAGQSTNSAHLNMLREYEDHLGRGYLKPRDPIEVASLFNLRLDAWMTDRFLEVIGQAADIAEHGIRIDRQDKKGVVQAIRFLSQQLASKTFHPEDEVQGGTAEKLGDRIISLMREIKEQAANDKLTIKTGIKFIDDNTGGFDRRTLNLVLGKNGQRKTTIVRTAAYYACRKHRVMYIPLESSVDEELANFAFMHAHQPDEFLATEKLSALRYLKGWPTWLNEEEEKFVETDLTPNFKRVLGQNLVIQGTVDNTWPAVRSLIEAEDAKAPLDLVVIDYIGLFDTSAGRDPVFLMHQWIKDMKQMCLHHDGNRGLTIVSPVQGNRKGYDYARDHDGNWETAGIDRYGEMEKSADSVMFTYREEQAVTNNIRLGFCKTRRSGTIPAQDIVVDPVSQLVGGSPMKEASASRPKRPVSRERYVGINEPAPITPKKVP